MSHRQAVRLGPSQDFLCGSECLEQIVQTREPVSSHAGSNLKVSIMDKKRLSLLVIPLAAAIGWAALTGSAETHARIAGTEAQKLVQAGARLVAVRTPEEFQVKHLPDAVNIPVQQLTERMKELEPKDRAIVLYCRSGHRSGIAYEQLAKAGYSQLHDLGPMTAW